MKSWHYTPHVADICTIISGDSYAELFQAAAEALYDITKPVFVQKNSRIIKNLSMKAESAELLLIDFLSELIYFLEAEKIAVHEYQWATCSAQGFSIKLIFAPISHLAGVGIKAITYHHLQIENKNNLLSTPLIFDI